jgi:DNA invertase Pin-like site-specific DNA recombinase
MPFSDENNSRLLLYYFKYILTKVSSIDTDTQDMKTIVLMNADASEKDKNLVDGFLASRNQQGALFQMASPSENGQTPPIRDVLGLLMPGDLLVIAEATMLGDKFSAVMHELVYLFEQGIGLGIADAGTLIDAKGLKGRDYARIIAFIADLFKKMNSNKTKTALKMARQHGKKIGRPAGISRLDGKEVEICEYLNKRVSKSAISRILGISRANLAQFIVARNLESKDCEAGGKSHGKG